MWHFYDYIEPQSGRNPFDDWLRALPADAQAAIDARILHMTGMQKWPEKWASLYKGTKGTSKIIELRIPWNKVQYRPLGMYAPNHSFILLEGAIEKSNKIPQSRIDNAVQRQKRFEENPSCVTEH